LRRSYNLKPAELIGLAAKLTVKPSLSQVRRTQTKLLRRLMQGHEEAQNMVLKQSRLKTKNVEGYDLVIYRGSVFRGDLRPPQVIFKEGFTLKASSATLKRDIHQLTGVRGGFGADATADGLDGRGLSTSVFFRKENVGAATYGVDRGGYNYLVDARKYDGYHLYQNQHNARYVKAQDLQPGAFKTEDDYLRALKNAEHNPKLTPGAEHAEPLTFSPTEINYADDLPPSAILGAYDEHGVFIANEVGLDAFASQQAARRNRKMIRKAAASASAKNKQRIDDDAPPEPMT
jgi:hypothetical protein